MHAESDLTSMQRNTLIREAGLDSRVLMEEHVLMTGAAKSPMDLLDARLREVLRSRNIIELHPVQENVFLPVYGGKNILVCAPTGIGKTEAAMLPVLQKMIEEKGSGGIRCLYITPLRATPRLPTVRFSGIRPPYSRVSQARQRAVRLSRR